MKLDYALPLKNLGGKPFTDEDNKPHTLGSAIIFACSVAAEGDQQMTPVDKFKLGEIAMTVHKGLDLTVEQASVAKDRIAKLYASPLLVYIIHNALENTATGQVAPLAVAKKRR
jgi:hypothetical protein